MSHDSSCPHPLQGLHRSFSSSCSSPPKLRALPAALVAALFAFPVSAAAAEATAEREEGDAARLPAVEVRSQRYLHDPRPGPLGSATRTATDAREVPQTVVWEEAENRLHVQKALLEYLVHGRFD